MTPLTLSFLFTKNTQRAYGQLFVFKLTLLDLQVHHQPVHAVGLHTAYNLGLMSMVGKRSLYCFMFLHKLYNYNI